MLTVQVTLASFLVFWRFRDTFNPRAELKPALSYLVLTGVILFGQTTICWERIKNLSGPYYANLTLNDLLTLSVESLYGITVMFAERLEKLKADQDERKK